MLTLSRLLMEKEAHFYFGHDWNILKNCKSCNYLPSFIKIHQLSLETNTGENDLLDGGNNICIIMFLCFKYTKKTVQCTTRTGPSHYCRFISWLFSRLFFSLSKHSRRISHCPEPKVMEWKFLILPYINTQMIKRNICVCFVCM